MIRNITGSGVTGITRILAEQKYLQKIRYYIPII